MDQPFFIVGLGRCGSTLLWSFLEKHPKIALTNEAHVADFLSFCARFAAVPGDEPIELEYFERASLRGIVHRHHAAMFADLFQEHAKGILEDFYRRGFAHKEFTHWGDKLPSPATIPDLQHAYPQAKFVAMVRDPRDSWCSFREYRARPEYRDRHPTWHRLTVEDWGRNWRNLYDSLERDLGEALVLRYEDLVREPLPGVRRALEFLGLEGADELGAAAPGPRATRHGTVADVQHSLERWRSELDASEQESLARACRDVMKRFGYPAW